MRNFQVLQTSYQRCMMCFFAWRLSLTFLDNKYCSRSTLAFATTTLLTTSLMLWVMLRCLFTLFGRVSSLCVHGSTWVREIYAAQKFLFLMDHQTHTSPTPPWAFPFSWTPTLPRRSLLPCALASFKVLSHPQMTSSLAFFTRRFFL